MLWTFFWATACLIGPGLVSGRTIPGSHVLHAKRDERSQFSKRDRLDPETPLVMKIALKQQNLDQAEDWLMRVSNPSSPHFAQYWTPEDVIEAFEPSSDSLEAVLLWLESAGVERHRVTHSENKQWLVFGTSASVAESLFYTNYHEYHDLQGRSMAGTDRIHLPRHLTDHIDFVKPGVVTQPMPLTKRKQRQALAHASTSQESTLSSHKGKQDHSTTPNCTKEVSPECLSTLLNMPFCDPSTTVICESSFGTLQIGSYYIQSDLDLYWKEFFPDRIPQGTGPVFASIDGGVLADELLDWGSTKYYGHEPLLDLQQTIPFYYPNNVTNIQQDDEWYAYDHDKGLLGPLLDAIDGSYCTSCSNGICGNDPVIDPKYPDDPRPGSGHNHWALYKGEYQCGTFQPPSVIASSYYSGYWTDGEPDEHAVAYSMRQCAEILKLSLQGVTFLFASGDSGVGGDDTCTRFVYSHPNGCPYVLVVGGTMIGKGKTEQDPEVVWQTGPAGTQPWKGNFSSGAGFSNIFDRPSYQKAVVDAYMQDHAGYPSYSGAPTNSTVGYYNRDGRAYPDCAANAGPVPMWAEGRRQHDGGTSMAVQMVGVMLARIVDERRKAGKPNPALGQVHEVFYAHPEVFEDVVSGNNPGCGTDGFSAAPGWDVPTGLGVPNYEKLLELYLSLP